MASKQPSWERCSQDDCTGIRLPTTAWRRAHAADQAPEAFDAELKRISAEGIIHARGWSSAPSCSRESGTQLHPRTAGPPSGLLGSPERAFRAGSV